MTDPHAPHGPTAGWLRRGAPGLSLALVLLAGTWTSATNSAAEATDRVAVPEPVTAAAGAAEPATVTVQPAQPVSHRPSIAAPVAPSVIVRVPDVLVELEETGTAEQAAAMSARSDVEHVAVARRLEVQLVDSGPLGSNEQSVGTEEALTLLQVDPLSFRPLTPEVTAQSPAVWERLASGDAIIGHDVALQRGLELGDTVQVVTPDGTRELRIGALAATGAPPLADILVAADDTRRLLTSDWNLALVAAIEGTGPVWLGEQLIDDLDGATFERLDAPSQQVTGWGALETFRYVDIGGGRIEILGDWVSRFIVTVDLPIVGRTRCNRLMVPQLVAALNEIVRAGLADLIDPAQFGGCWVARHIDWNPAKPLSMHAWGLAVDLNVATNGLGRTPTMDHRIVEIFQRWGFYWGGWWDRPDGMHFQVSRFVAVA
ncbi:MAG: M15 family metallopeptidase [Nitriliruptorales bacterium]|nr:M15 family metallopeptidase [Nitriliruptorales bacterium]